MNYRKIFKLIKQYITKPSDYAKSWNQQMKKKHKRVNSGWMRRTSRIYLKELNKGKVEKIKKCLNLYHNATMYTISRLWSEHDMSSELLNKETTDKIKNRFHITARLSQCVGKQAKETVASQRKKSKKKQRIPRISSTLQIWIAVLLQ